MTREEIANLFIRAAWIDSRLPDDARPKKVKGSWVPFFHSVEDINDRRATGIRSGKHKSSLQTETTRLMSGTLRSGQGWRTG